MLSLSSGNGASLQPPTRTDKRKSSQRNNSHKPDGSPRSSVGSRHSRYSLRGHRHHKSKDELLYFISRIVTLQYGPYSYQGILDFRLERLLGIQKILQKVGAKVNLLPLTDMVNRVKLWYMENVIFSCKMTDLIHGGDGEMDPLCITAAKAFNSATRRSLAGLRDRCLLYSADKLNPYCECILGKDEDDDDQDEDGEEDEGEIIPEEQNNNKK